MPRIEIDRIRLFAIQATPEWGPESSLGSMPTRNGLLVEATSKEGVTGWGEIWCNFPPQGNIARLNLFADVIVPEILGRAFSNFSEIRPYLEHRFKQMAIHTGEPGPFRQCIAGLDMAAADIASRLSGQSLSDFLSQSAQKAVRVYASTPNILFLEDVVAELMENGHVAFKLKVGFGSKQDLSNLRLFRKCAPQVELMVDANQNWSPVQALENIRRIEEFHITFIEEPLLATAPIHDWATLCAHSSFPVAAGENIISAAMFRSFLTEGGIQVVQPDVAKWGGISGAMEVADLTQRTGATCAMHCMGTALGLAASLHVMAFMGGTGPVELDANPNPLRTELGDLNQTVKDGFIAVPEGHGFGFTPDPWSLEQFSVAKFSTG